jgi:hypothetical protein
MCITGVIIRPVLILIRLHALHCIATVADCPVGASGAPSCRCHWAMDGDLAFDSLSQRWVGTCTPAPAPAAAGTVYNTVQARVLQHLGRR